jgi:hypothetical protein
VIVNRLWQWHFGKPLAANPSDFGVMGSEPTHAELLDWLARWFVADGWSFKSMHRLIVTSRAYRLATAGFDVEWSPEQTAAARDIWDHSQAADPENEWLWRRERQQLDGEAIRDAMLAAAGLLTAERGGPGVMPPLPQELLSTLLKNQWSASKREEALLPQPFALLLPRAQPCIVGRRNRQAAAEMREPGGQRQHIGAVGALRRQLQMALPALVDAALERDRPGRFAVECRVAQCGIAPARSGVTGGAAAAVGGGARPQRLAFAHPQLCRVLRVVTLHGLQRGAHELGTAAPRLRLCRHGCRGQQTRQQRGIPRFHVTLNGRDSLCTNPLSPCQRNSRLPLRCARSQKAR